MPRAPTEVPLQVSRTRGPGIFHRDVKYTGSIEFETPLLTLTLIVAPLGLSGQLRTLRLPPITTFVDSEVTRASHHALVFMGLIESKFDGCPPMHCQPYLTDPMVYFAASGVQSHGARCGESLETLCSALSNPVSMCFWIQLPLWFQVCEV